MTKRVIVVDSNQVNYQNVQEDKSPGKDTPDSAKRSRAIPHSDIDFQLMTTNTEWGGINIPPELRHKLSNWHTVTDENGNYAGDQREALWELLGFYTRDMRLSNLTVWNGEMAYVQYYIDLANLALQADQKRTFLIALGFAATKLETAQSKNGFLRQQMNTFRQENVMQELEPKKKSFFGFNQNKEEQK